jgi:hypothetical protein
MKRRSVGCALGVSRAHKRAITRQEDCRTDQGGADTLARVHSPACHLSHSSSPPQEGQHSSRHGGRVLHSAASGLISQQAGRSKGSVLALCGAARTEVGVAPAPGHIANCCELTVSFTAQSNMHILGLKLVCLV